jgi:hypothetical protein
MTYPAYSMLMNGEISQALLYVLNNYFIFGAYWILLGASLYMALHAKTQNNLLSLAGLSIYILAVGPFMSVAIYREFANYVVAIIIFLLAAAIYLLFIK